MDTTRIWYAFVELFWISRIMTYVPIGITKKKLNQKLL